MHSKFKSYYDSICLVKKPAVLIQIICIIFFLAVLYFPVFNSLVHDWIDIPEFSHGFFIPFIFLYLVGERFKVLMASEVLPKNSGFILILFGLLLLFVGNLAAENFTMRFSFLVVLSGIILSMLSWQHLLILLFPISFLVFMIPIPSILMIKFTFPLQIFASMVASESLQLLGIPVLREGNVIHLSHTTLNVAEACSGIRSLISLLTLGTIFSYLTQKTPWKRVCLVVLIIPIAIIVNAIRVSATGILASQFGSAVAEGFFHDFSGLLLFFFAFLLMCISGFILNKLKI